MQPRIQNPALSRAVQKVLGIPFGAASLAGVEDVVVPVVIVGDVANLERGSSAERKRCAGGGTAATLSTNTYVGVLNPVGSGVNIEIISFYACTDFTALAVWGIQTTLQGPGTAFANGYLNREVTGSPSGVIFGNSTAGQPVFREFGVGFLRESAWQPCSGYPPGTVVPPGSSFSVRLAPGTGPGGTIVLACSFVWDEYPRPAGIGA